jgi:hypothetical protein
MLFKHLYLNMSEALENYERREVEITGGKNIINIITDGFSNALVIERAVAVNWPDCRGSIGEYYSVSDNGYEKQKELTENLNNVLISGSDEEIFAAISKFLELFSNGVYDITLSRFDPESTLICHDKSMVYSDNVKTWERFTCNYYNSNYDDVFLFSRSYESIDQNRVSYYVNLIKHGGRPKMILYNHDYRDDGSLSSYYILDGHHKLLAYEKAGLPVPVIYISREDNLRGRTVSIIPQIIHALKPNEIEHTILNSNNIADVSPYMDKTVTTVLDKILKEYTNIGTEITQLLYNAYQSINADQRKWVIERLSVLKRNKNSGNGQYLYYKIFSQKENYIMWHRIHIENSSDFELWENIYLKDGDVPAYLSEKEKEINNKYHPPYEAPEQYQNTINEHIVKRDSNRNTWFYIRVFLLIIVAIRLIISIMR